MNYQIIINLLSPFYYSNTTYEYMGRKRKYNTEEEVNNAIREKSMRYYWKNAKKIREKNLERYYNEKKNNK